ncbi:MAG: GDP-mannose 4,6-dehydratase [Actinobacteria bacterium]|nr:GDP-mannose 4,6-dehydratase [Actinomycetota bacterium]
MHTLVTGGAGFIGSNLVDRLLDDGHTVEVIDNLSSGKPANLRAALAHESRPVVLHEIDVRDPALADVFDRSRPEVVFHLAAQIDVRISVADPKLDADVNIMGSLNVIEAARAAGARKVVFASSGGTIYGRVADDDFPVDESHPQAPLSPYGVSKKAVGDYLSAFRDLHGLDYTALALANVYGPRQDPHGEAGVVAIFANRLLAGEPCRIYGDGSQTRDYVYVHDVVDAFARAIDRAGGMVCNIGTATETSVLELYRTMAAAAGVDADPDFAPERLGEVARSSLDASRASRELGWTPSTELPEGTAAVLDYFR